MAVLLVMGGQAKADLVNDGNGLNAGPGPWQGTVRLQSGADELAVDVDFCVYAPGKFDDSYTVPAAKWNDEHYYYAYQILNDLSDGGVPFPPPWSDGYVTRFSIGLYGLTGDDQADNVWYIDNTGDATPVSVDINPVMFGQIGWEFAPSPPDLGWPKTSDVLFYSSPFPPEYWVGTVSGNASSTSWDLPNPVPEPGALALLAVGMTALCLRKRRRGL